MCSLLVVPMPFSTNEVKITSARTQTMITACMVTHRQKRLPGDPGSLLIHAQFKSLIAVC